MIVIITCDAVGDGLVIAQLKDSWFAIHLAVEPNWTFHRTINLSHLHGLSPDMLCACALVGYAPFPNLVVLSALLNLCQLSPPVPHKVQSFKEKKRFVSVECLNRT